MSSAIQPSSKIACARTTIQLIKLKKNLWIKINRETTWVYFFFLLIIVYRTSGYATMVHGRGCNPHRCTTTFANLETASLWRHRWRHNSETIRDREKWRPPRAMKSSELSNGEKRIALRQLCKTGNDVIDDVIIWVQDGNCKKWLDRILVLVRSTI